MQVCNIVRNKISFPLCVHRVARQNQPEQTLTIQNVQMYTRWLLCVCAARANFVFQFGRFFFSASSKIVVMHMRCTATLAHTMRMHFIRQNACRFYLREQRLTFIPTNIYIIWWKRVAVCMCCIEIKYHMNKYAENEKGAKVYIVCNTPNKHGRKRERNKKISNHDSNGNERTEQKKR